jgi:hypothetical protein
MTEMNTFVYNEKGRPEADKGKHDDMIFALGLALMGLDQADDFEEEVQLERKPRTTREILEWESKTGKLYSENKTSFWDAKNSWSDTDTKSPMSNLR